MTPYTLTTTPDRVYSDGRREALVPGRQMIVEGADFGEQVMARSWIEAKQKFGFELTPWQMDMLGRAAA